MDDVTWARAALGMLWKRMEREIAFDDERWIRVRWMLVNGDGLLDVVTSNKKGTHYFQQVRK